MINDRIVYHVVPNANRTRWVVTRESSSSFREEYETKDRAVEAAKARAQDEGPSVVKVHKSGGDTEYERTYEAELRRSVA